jgi:TolB protein
MQILRISTRYRVTAVALAVAATALAQESAWFREARQLTTADMGLEKAGEAYFSPDGKRVCFQAVPKGQSEYQIYVINIDGSGLERVSTGIGATTCAYFHPDGKRLLFGSNHLDPRPVATPQEVAAAAEKAGVRNYQWSFFPGMDIFEYDFAGKSLTRLIDTPGYDAEASYSPDGKSLVFTTMRDGDQEVYVSDARGGNARRITNSKGYDGGPFFSPDGKRIVYRSDRHNNGNLQIFINNLEGTAERALTADKNVLHWCPFWHPSGKWLIFTRAEHREDARPNYDLYLLPVPADDDRADAAAIEARAIRVTVDPTFDGLPVFSPDGKWLMWTSKRGGLAGAQVFIAEFVGLSRDGTPTGSAGASK